MPCLSSQPNKWGKQNQSKSNMCHAYNLNQLRGKVNSMCHHAYNLDQVGGGGGGLKKKIYKKFFYF